MREIRIAKTRVFDRNIQAKTRFVINQGGSRSSKTFSILQCLIAISLQQPNSRLVFSVVRKTGTALRNSAYRDFLEILRNASLYEDENHNRMTGTYTLFGNTFEFFGADSAQKLRGRKRHYLYVNEANELSSEEFKQLNLRTEKQVFIDYNPSDISSWIYDLLENRPSETTFIKSTFLDNDFLEEEVRNEILALQHTDPEAWQIFGLGEKAESQYLIYPRWTHYDSSQPFPIDDHCYGLDTGYTHPTALIKASFRENTVYWEEVIYQTRMTVADIIERMAELEIPKDVIIYCDSADPKTIEELVRHGYSALKSDKSVKAGIDLCKSLDIRVASSSVNLQKELRDYKWQRVNDVLTDRPVKFNDDGLDACRYATYNWHLSQRQPEGSFQVWVP